MPIRRLVPLLVALALGACAGDAAPPAQTGPAADSARVLLLRASPATADSAFERLERASYRAEIRVQESGGPPRLYAVSNRTSGGVASGPRLTNPVGGLVPGDAPHLDPRSAELYRLRLLPSVVHRGRRLAGAEALLIDTTGGESIRRVRSWVDQVTGAPYAVEVWRASTSAIFDEHSRAGVFFAGGSHPLPRAATSDSRVSIPLGEPRRVLTEASISPER